MQTDETGFTFKGELDAIIASDLPQMDKLAEAFRGLTGFIIEATERQIELARAMKDDEETTKHQVKLETIKHARKIFQTCYWHVTGRWAWDHEDQR